MRSCRRSRCSESESGDDFAASSRGSLTGVMPRTEIRQGRDRDRDRIGGVVAHGKEEGVGVRGDVGAGDWGLGTGWMG